MALIEKLKNDLEKEMQAAEMDEKQCPPGHSLDVGMGILMQRRQSAAQELSSSKLISGTSL